MAEGEEKKSSKAYVGLYITFCVLFITWLTSKFFRGRRQMHQAFHTIEEQLQRMQDHLDQRQKEEADRMIEYPSPQQDEKAGKASEPAGYEPEKDKMKAE